MRKLYKIFIAAALILLAFKVNAQNSGFDQLIKSSPADASKLVQAYAEPLFKGFGEGLNSGWNNTAKTKKFLHFDLRITANLATVPTMDKTFDVTKIGLSSHVTPANPSQIIAPTFGGAKVDGPVMNINNDNGVKVGSFTMPKGQIGYIPAPNIQLTVGLFKNTDLTIRTTPTIKIGSDAGSVGMIGFGLKHDLIQDFAKKLPKPFDLAIAVNYNRLNYSNTLNVQPDAGTTAAPGQSSDFSNQRIDAHFTGFNVQAILSKKLLFFTPFVAVAYETATTDFGVLGNYPITSSNPAQPNMYVSVANPVSISETSVSGMRADVGFQLNLAIFRIYAAYSTGKYSSVNGGIGLGF
ncbi:MAG: DUF6588 family protein [Mucilaginibacter sp.]